VSPHPNCKKHLKKSTKVDAEYNLPTGVPKTRVNKTKRQIPGVELRVHHVLPRGPHSPSIITINNWSYANIQGTFREHSGDIQGTSREHPGNTQGTSREHSVNIQGTLREHSGNIQGNFREHPVDIQGTLKKQSGNIQRTFRGHSGNNQGAIRERSEDIQRVYNEIIQQN
jgi:hypothetical protein